MFSITEKEKAKKMLTSYELKIIFHSKQGNIFINELQLRQNLLYAHIEKKLIKLKECFYILTENIGNQML